MGLVNQGATCYLSSVLQSLFMTPEFRLALYRCGLHRETADKGQLISVDLQKLFGSLQLSKRRAVDTKLEAHEVTRLLERGTVERDRLDIERVDKCGLARCALDLGQREWQRKVLKQEDGEHLRDKKGQANVNKCQLAYHN